MSVNGECLTLPHLSQGEQFLVRLVHCGLHNKAIAARAGITENAVKQRLRHIFDKTGMGNRVELALWWEAKFTDAVVRWEKGKAGNEHIRELAEEL